MLTLVRKLFPAKNQVHKRATTARLCGLSMPFGKVIKWLLALGMLASLVGSASALFLWGMDAVTRQRFATSWLIYLLPLAGVVMGFYYRKLGKHVDSGNAVILTAAHKQDSPVPFVLAPSIMIATLVTHLFGGSAGREGTAVQMGAAIASLCGKWVATTQAAMRLLLFCGIAAGFGAVFGTPFAGAIFALEFVRHRIISRKIIPCLATALAADWVCMAWGANHTTFPRIDFARSITTYLPIVFKLALAATVLALASRFFIFAARHTAAKFRQAFPHEAVRAGAGGLMIIGLFLILGTGDYLGLGVLPEHENSLTLSRFFSPETQAPASAWLWKLVFTLLTICSGFKGGEVTPLFFIGAALGNSLAWFLNAPVDLFAGVGMIAFFAAATKTPYASIVMGIELLGWHVYAPLVLSTLIACRLSGPGSVYPNAKDL